MAIKGRTKHGVKNPGLYDQLRASGMSSAKAKKVANASVQSGSNNRTRKPRSDEALGRASSQSRTKANDGKAKQAMEQMPLTLARSLVIVANQNADREVCGFIMRDWSLYPIANMARGSSSFQMDVEMLSEFYQRHLSRAIGIYHSHPNGRELPSEEDWNQWPAVPSGLKYYIVTKQNVIEYKMDGTEPVEVVRYP